MRSKRLFIFLSLTITYLFVNTIRAQDYQTGLITDGAGHRKEILYDRTQIVVADNVYKSLYKIFDKKKKLQCTITLVHNRPQSLLLITVRPENAPSFGNTVKYDKNISGLIFSNVAKLDTNYRIENHYTYLFSFTDTVFEYAALHKIKADATSEMMLDPLNVNRVKKHNSIITKLLQTDAALSRFLPETESKINLFNKQLIRLRDTLSYKSGLYNMAVDTIQRRIQEDISFYFKKVRPAETEMNYKGDKVKGKPSGKGLLINAGNVYDGNFKSGNFLSGYVSFKREDYEYIGNYGNDTFSGIGRLKYKSGNYLLGVFNKGQLEDGVSLMKTDSSSYFYGAVIHGKHSGYGELSKDEVEIYLGEFTDGKLMKGYTRQYNKRDELEYYKTEYGERIKINQTDAERYLQLLIKSKDRF